MFMEQYGVLNCSLFQCSQEEIQLFKVQCNVTYLCCDCRMT